MGVKGLNSLIMKWCRKQIQTINMKMLFGKKIAIDTSIYMYNFKARKLLLKGFNDMIVMFKNNNITPIFIFDGKTPIEKNETLNIRRENKKKSEDEYNLLLEKLLISDRIEKKALVINRKDIISRLKILENQFVRIRREDIYNVKQLMDLYGATYYEHDGEAEQLCAKLVTDGIAYACMSDDMDLFVYGCPRILKQMDLSSNTITFYDLEDILKSLNVNLNEFKSICILSGTDYNKKCENPIYIKNAFNLFSMYKRDVNMHRARPNSFYYYINSVKRININYKELFGIIEMFNLSSVKIPKELMFNHSLKNVDNDESREKLLNLLSL
jgi:flap endonuclease-1